MGKFDHIAAAVIRPGKLVEMKLNMLPGKPEIDVEHLGDTNPAYVADLVASANVELVEAGDPNAILTDAQRTVRADRWRSKITRFAAKHLRARHTDGTAATDADLPEFIAALPRDVVETVFVFCRDPENFRERPAAPAEKIAEKS